jgi:hypothetical protein
MAGARELVRKVQENQLGLKLISTHQLLETLKL